MVMKQSSPSRDSPTISSGRLPKRVLNMIGRLAHGQTLVRTMISGEPHYHYRPSGLEAPRITAEEAIASGLLKPGEDGFFPGADQTWTR